jgi:MAP/microtubule affinity-regulating kinase
MSTKPSSRSSKRDKDDSNNPDLHLSTIGSYNILKTLGEGNFAKVKLATHSLTGAEVNGFYSNAKVAIKVIDKTQLDDKKLQKLYREVRIMKSLHHPHIIKLYEVIETKNTVFLVMEYCSGGELYDYLVVHGKMKERDARAKFRQILSAVSYCHKKQIIHRDLKAENLLLDKDLNIKIADFGFSNVFDPESKLDTFCGSPPYAAPELFQGRRYVGPEVDIWSLGVILYVLCTGCLPFDGKNLQEMRESVCRGKYRIPFYLSDTCERLLRKFLVRDPLRRHGLEIVIDDTWLNDGYGDSPISVDLGQKVEEDEKVIKLMATKYQVSREEVLQALRGNAYNDIAATYYLLYHEQEVRNTVQAEADRGEILASPFSSMNTTKTASPTMNRIEEDAASLSGSGEISKSSKQKERRPRRQTVSHVDDTSGSSVKKEKEGKGSKSDFQKSEKTSSSDSRRGSKGDVQKGSKSDVGKTSKGSKSDVQKASKQDENSQESLTNPRADRKRNNTIVGILRDRIRRPSELTSPMSPSGSKGNDINSSGEIGSITPGDENKPRSLRFTFNSNTTSSKQPDDIIAEIMKACNKLAVTQKLTSKYLVECAWNNPASGKETTRLEIEVCKLPRLNNLHGLRFKRLGGTSSDYKELCEKLLAAIQL